MVRLLRENRYVSYVLVLIRLYLGWDWMTAGWGKINEGFDASGFLTRAIENPVIEKGTNELIYPTFTGFIENFALPNVGLFNFLIPWGEFLVGLGLILGCLTTAAMFFGLLMNFMFMFAGTVSSNPWMIFLGVIVLVSGYNAGKWGLDYWVIPYLRKYYKEKIRKTPATPSA